MGSNLQCDFSYATFHIGDKFIKFNIEPRVTHMLEDNIHIDATYFLDIEMNTFKVEIIIQEIEKSIVWISQETTKCINS